MKEYIEKEAALNILKELHAEAESPSAAEDLFEAHERIGDIPPANVKPVVKSKWELWAGALPKCPVCGYEYADYIECDKFCGNCGADMRQEQG